MTPFSLDTADTERRLRIEPVDPATPETTYERGWAQAVAGHVITRLQAEMTGSGQSARFEAFKDFLTGSQPVAYATLASRLDMSEAAVNVGVHRLRRRFSRLLREEVAQTVDDPAVVSDEIRFLIEALGKS